jgi:hypothetical protein
MTLRRVLEGLLLAAAGFALAGACSATPAGAICNAGQRVRCSCEGALTGTVECDSTGHEGPCDCSDAEGAEEASSSSSGGTSSSSSGSSSGSSGGDDAATGPDGSGPGDATEAGKGSEAGEGGKK